MEVVQYNKGHKKFIASACYASDVGKMELGSVRAREWHNKRSGSMEQVDGLGINRVEWEQGASGWEKGDEAGGKMELRGEKNPIIPPTSILFVAN